MFSDKSHDVRRGSNHAALWNAYNREYMQYETNLLPAFPWNREEPEDVPRYVKGEDGFWFNPAVEETGAALVSCTGDLMCEPRQHHAYRYGDSYFFHPSFQFVRGIFKTSDFVIGNLETTLTDATPYAGEYHRIAGVYHCNAPACYLAAIRYAGFDALVNANNHSCDSTVTGLLDTLDALDEYRFMHTGVFRSKETERVLFVRVNGIRLAVLSYATYFNKHDRWLTENGKNTLLNSYSKERAQADIAYARQCGAEFILVYIHWGKEYTHEPNDIQRRYAQELACAGADYIVGSHTHCLQPHGVVAAADGRRIPLVYSMGNFITNEKKEISRHTGILQLLLCREKGAIKVRGEYFIPCYVYPEFGSGRFAAVPTDALLNGKADNSTLRNAQKYINDLMGLPQLPTAAVSIHTVCTILHTLLPEGMEDKTCTRICTRPHEAVQGALYFALAGEDEATLSEVCQNGAVAVLTPRPVAGVPCIAVEDVQDAYCKVCAYVKKHFRAKTVTVAGHSGKTAAKELISAVLRSENTVLTSKDGLKSENAALQQFEPLKENDALAWQRLHPHYAYYVQELREDDVPSRAVNARAIRPEFCVLTGSSGQDAESAERLVNEVAAGIRTDGILLINADDAALVAAAQGIDASGRIRVATFGMQADAEYRAEKVHTDGKELAFDVRYGGGYVPLRCALPIADEIYPVLAAFAVGTEAGMEAEKIAQAIRKYRYAGYCRNLVQCGGLTLLLNCNCRSEASAKAAIDAFDEVSPAEEGRRIAILGDIDIDNPTGAAYQTIGKHAAKKSIAYICCCGVHANSVREAAVEQGFSPECIQCAGTEQELESIMLELLRPNDAVLFNGGRCIHFNFTLRRLFGFMDGRVD